jgi:signal transduction histidine kinase
VYSIFLNLISNSIKYSRPDVRSIIRISSRKDGNRIVLVFSDNGMGIDLEAAGKKIFGLYQRFHKHTEGKGVGLYMVKTQVEALGGRISVTSDLNVGTMFTLVFEET